MSSRGNSQAFKSFSLLNNDNMRHRYQKAILILSSVLGAGGEREREKLIFFFPETKSPCIYRSMVLLYTNPLGSLLHFLWVPTLQLLCALFIRTCTCDMLWRPALGLLELLCRLAQRARNAWEFTFPGAALTNDWPTNARVWNPRSLPLKLRGMVYVPGLSTGSGWGWDFAWKCSLTYLFPFHAPPPPLPYWFLLGVLP